MNSHTEFPISQILKIIVNKLPNPIISELISDKEFSTKIDMTVDTRITFNNNEKSSFLRNSFYEATKNAFIDNNNEAILIDEEEREWKLSITQKNEIPIASLSCENVTISSIGIIWPLSNNINQRISVFEEIARKNGLSQSEVDKWLPILSENEISNDDIDQLITNLNQSPYHIEGQLSYEIMHNNFLWRTLVPNNIIYYERLIGKYDSSKNILEYCEHELKQHFKERINKQIKAIDLCISLQYDISKIIAENLFDYDDFKNLIEYAIKVKHPVLLVSCMEIALFKFPDQSSENIRLLFEELKSDIMQSRFQMLSALVIFIDGELSRLNIFYKKPPFYRRLASLSHASFLLGIFINNNRTINDVEEWAKNERGIYFLSQNLIDLRIEPRWLPDHVYWKHLQSDFYGRIYNCTLRYDHIIDIKKSLTDNSLISFESLLPSMLEANIFPAESSSKEELKELSNYDDFIKLSMDLQLNLVGEKGIDKINLYLEENQYQFKGIEDTDHIYYVLSELSKLACIFKNEQLASNVMILNRIYQKYIDINQKFGESLCMGMRAATAFSDKDKWSNYIGQWVWELANQDIKEKNCHNLKEMLERLCVIEPYLFYTCSNTLELLRILNP